jgi:hypothetical protein
VLSQLSASYLIKPDLGGCKYMYQRANEPVGDPDGADPRFVISGPRAGQQVAISGGHEDAGSHGPLWGEERYQPFEGTGAVSNWVITFPRHASATQRAVIDSLQDIIVHVRYSAVDAGKGFAEQVKALSETGKRKGESQPQRQARIGISSLL